MNLNGKTQLNMPRARALLDGASLGPDALKAVTTAFDAAWAEIASRFSHDPMQCEGARLLLANALLSVASDDSRDVEVLKQAGLQAMARNYTSLPIRQQSTEHDWQQKAKEARRLAQTTTDKFIKHELLQIAASYDRIAKLEREQVKGAR